MPEHAFNAAAAPRARRDSGVAGPDIGAALWIAALCIIALALTWIVAELVPAGQVRDALTLHDFASHDTPHVAAVADFLLEFVEPLLFTIWGIALVLFALAGARPRVALAIAVVMGLAPLSADALKPLLAHPHLRVEGVHVGPASWPSGHATAALSLALCAVLVAPAGRRPGVAAAGAIFTAAIGCALLVRAWHMPSDVLGGYLLAVLWMALAVAALRAGEHRWPKRSGAEARPA